MKIEIYQAPLGTLIVMFIIYVLIHIGIGYLFNRFKKMKEGKQMTLEDINTLKFLTFTFKWWPAIYVVVTVIILWSLQ